MLAQNFKTAMELRIEESDLEALIKVLGMLERGELVHTGDPETFEKENGFNMADYDFQDVNTCGTVCCIAGWCDRLFHTDLVDRHGTLPKALDTLFFGPSGKNFSCTTRQAANALRSYLATGETNWAEALA